MNQLGNTVLKLFLLCPAGRMENEHCQAQNPIKNNRQSISNLTQTFCDLICLLLATYLLLPYRKECKAIKKLRRLFRRHGALIKQHSDDLPADVLRCNIWIKFLRKRTDLKMQPKTYLEMPMSPKIWGEGKFPYQPSMQSKQFLNHTQISFWISTSSIQIVALSFLLASWPKMWLPIQHYATIVLLCKYYWFNNSDALLSE